MGLDNMWCQIVAPGQTADEFDMTPFSKVISGSVFAGGCSFRGKVYNSWLYKETDFSLYNEVLDASTIETIAAHLEDLPVPSDEQCKKLTEANGDLGVRDGDFWPFESSEEFIQFRDMFKAAAEKNMLLASWW